ncbi:uncharacterized protein LOC134680365 [Cydia fagiglandana]|uniref:uncharacterized protein LOC134680365 n=1 Tax=Cydia fagiglandana TaxID=1458189 RepID=UPI002FEDED57
MDEELNENDLEERLYAMIHHVDGTQADENAQQSHDASPRVDEAPRSTVRRYWKTNHNSAFQKVNTPKDAPTNRNTPNNKTPAAVNKNTPVPVNKSHAAAAVSDPKPKEEKDAPDSPPAGLFILQNTVPQNYTKTVEILEIDERPKVFELESSDEDEVVEVALPPKPTITIESSDEDELIIQNDKNIKEKDKNSSKENKSPNKNTRDVSASPVPSVQSSMSDDFIRGDCIALNISSAQPDSQSFDFSLHGSDLIGVSTPAKKKKKKKSKDRLTSTPINPEQTIQDLNNTDSIFATPKSKAKNKKPKTKSYTVSEKIIPNPDVYDSDSNQSAIDINKNHDAYTVTDKSFPSADVYESDSSVSESIKVVGQPAPQKKTNENDSSDSISRDLSDNTLNATDKTIVLDLTNDYTTLDSTQIEENIVIGNISGYSDVLEYGDSVENTTREELGEFCSTKVPQILYEDLDFDNLKGKDKVCKRRRYSLTTLRAEMDKFYNESWGGENFNHQEIQKNMSRDKSLWVIDPKDRMPNPPKRRVTCNYCNRVGHRDDTCRLKPPVCHMCGHTGHYEPRCPRKICVNCGSPNFMYSTSCRACAPWRGLACAECGARGHPASHCPDTWRRYHATIDENMPLEQCGEKPLYQLQCSGCTRRGHLAHTCRTFLPLCSLPVPSPHVARYFRLYPPTDTPKTHKRLSKSPTTHETHVNKRRNISDSDLNRSRMVSENEQNRPKKKSEDGWIARMRKNSESENRTRKNSQSAPASEPKEAKNAEAEKAPDFIPIGANTDSNGQVIQDNEVSDTSEVKTSARVYMTVDAMKRLSTLDGQDWLNRCMDRFNVDVQFSNASSFLTVVGTVGDQEAFHSELRAWSGRSEPMTPVAGVEEEGPQVKISLIPQKKNDVLRKLKNAFQMLKNNIGDPKAIFKELTYLQNRHQTIKNQKAISPVQLSKNRDRLNDMHKKLNMVLLGQAGLAGGAERLNALYSLQEKLINIRTQRVPRPLRSEISQHYQIIFTHAARNDYPDLVKKYYTTRPLTLKKNSPGKNKKKKKKKIDQQQKPVLTIKETVNNQPTEVDPVPILAASRSQQPNKAIKNMMKNLSCFYSRLVKNQPQNQTRNAMRLDIVYKILDVQKCLSEFEGQTKKLQTEKIKNALKIQRQAKAFLDGVKQKRKKNNTFHE